MAGAANLVTGQRLGATCPSQGTRRKGEFTPMQLAFIESYMVHRSGRRAAEDAGYANPAADGWKILRLKHVADEIDRRTEEARERNNHLVDQVVQGLFAVASVDITDVADFNDGSIAIKSSNTLSDSAKAAIKKVTFTPGQHGDKIQVEMNDKLKAYELLGKYLGIWVDKVETKTTVSFEDELRKLAGISDSPEDYDDL